MHMRLIVCLTLIPLAAVARLGDTEAAMTQRYGKATQVTRSARGWVSLMQTTSLRQIAPEAIDLRRYELAGVSVCAAFFTNSGGRVVVGEIYYGFPKETNPRDETGKALVRQWLDANADGHEWSKAKPSDSKYTRPGATAYVPEFLHGVCFLTTEYAEYLASIMKDAAARRSAEVTKVLNRF